MAGRRIVITKINTVGSMRNNAAFTKNKDRIDGGALNSVYCSIDHDNLTTYMRKEVWDLTKYKYPPYVQCDYVI
jgi:hypothetical protein